MYMRVYNGIVQPLIGSERINTKIDKIQNFWK